MTTDTDSRILQRLEKLEKGEGGLPPLLQFYRKLLLIQIAAKKQIHIKAGVSDESIRERLQQGLPLLSFSDLEIDLSLLQDVFVKVVDAFSSYPGLFAEITEKLRKPASGQLLTREAIKAWFNGEKLPPAMLNGISETLLRTIIQFTLKPLLTAYAKTLIASFEQEQWRRGYCPVCGGSPDMAFLDAERGARWLVCSRCDAEWLFQRLQCPYCGTQDQSALAFFTDEKEMYRLHVCEKCKCYLKTIDLRKSDAEVFMPLERVLTVEMDGQARKEGYRLPA